MRQIINEDDISEIVGGAVCLSEKRKRISFSTLGEGYDLKCSYKEAQTLVATLFVDNSDMSESEFDEFVKNTFAAKGWI